MTDTAYDDDKTDFIQRCIDTGRSIPPGVYRLSRTLTMRQGDELIGSRFGGMVTVSKTDEPTIKHKRRNA